MPRGESGVKMHYKKQKKKRRKKDSRISLRSSDGRAVELQPSDVQPGADDTRVRRRVDPLVLLRPRPVVH